MSDIFREVDEALKKDKVEAFWKKNGNLVIALVILIMAGTAIQSGYKAWIRGQQEQKTDILLSYENDPQNVDLSLLTSLEGDRKAVAQLLSAKELLKNNKLPEAFRAFSEVLSQKGASADVRGLAALYARDMVLNGQVDKTLSDVGTPEGTIWADHFRVQEALNLGSKERKPEEALKILDEISKKKDLAPALQEQVRQLKYVYEFDVKKGK